MTEILSDMVAAPVTAAMKQQVMDAARELDRSEAWIVRQALAVWLPRMQAFQEDDGA